MVSRKYHSPTRAAYFNIGSTSNADASGELATTSDIICGGNLKMTGGIQINITSTTTNTTLTTTESGLVVVNANAGPVTLVLPASASSTGCNFTVKKIDASANAIVLDANSAELIDGVQTTAMLDAQYDVLTIICDATSWHIADRGAALG